MSLFSLKKTGLVFAGVLLTLSNLWLPMAPRVFAETEGDAYFKNINDRYYALRFLLGCFEYKKDHDGGIDNISGTGLITHTSDNHSVGIGRFYGNSEGRRSCGNEVDVNNALELVEEKKGVEATKSFMSSIGYIKEGSSLSPPWKIKEGSSPDSIIKKIAAKVPVPLTPAKWYAYDRILASQCNHVFTMKPDEEGTAKKAVWVEVVEDSSTEPRKYKTKSQDVYIQENPSIDRFDYNNRNTTCEGLLDEVNKLAPETATYFSQNPQYAVLSTLSFRAAEAETTCAGGALGWFLCPVMKLLTEAVQTMAGFVGDFMEFKPLITDNPDDMTKPGNAIRKVWQPLVGIANLLMVIAFMVVIFSQATSMGLSSYGIKKMLPRIILAAVLINVSFYVCALLVDISNILGASVGGIVADITASLPNDVGLAHDYGPKMTGAVATNIVLVASATTIAAFTGAIAFIIPIVLSVFVSLLFLFLVLATRHILAILLIIISPLAFAAMILPNTADTFKRWWKALVTILALYPIIMLLAHGSLLVSKIILITGDKNDEVNSLIVRCLALVVMVAWIWALKFIVTWGSGVLGKVAGMVNDKNKGLIDRSRNWAKNKQDRSSWSQSRKLKHGAGDTAAQRRAIERINSGKGLLGRSSRMGAYGVSGLVGGKGITPYGKQSGELVAAQAAETADKIHSQSVAFARQDISKNFNAKDRDSGVNGRGLKRLAAEAQLAAERGDQVRFDAITSFAASGGADEYRSFHEDLQRRLKPGENSHFKSMFDKSMGFVSSTMSGELGPKNPALAAVLQTQNSTTSIKDEMYNDLGMRQMYNKVGADKHATYSSDEAKAAAKFISDETLKELVENKGGKYSLSDSAREAYTAEYQRMLDGTREFAGGVGTLKNANGERVVSGKIEFDSDGNAIPRESVDLRGNPNQDALPGL